MDALNFVYREKVVLQILIVNIMDNLKSNSGLFGLAVWILDASLYPAVTISSIIFVQ